MKTKIIVLFPLIAFMAIACGGNSKSSGLATAEADYSYSQDQARTQSAEAYDGGQPEAEATPQEALAPKVIRTADMRMEVGDYSKAKEQVAQLIKLYEGELVSQEEQQYGNVVETRLTVKVAPERFDSLLAELEGLASYLDHKSINAEDVTRQYIDLETRLESKRAVVSRYRELLKQAKNVREVLAVEENLRKLIEEIESIEGQLRYLSRQVDKSTINLTLYKKSAHSLVQRSFWGRIGEGFVDGWNFLKDIVVGMVAIWPVLLILLLAGTWWVRRKRRK